MAPTLHAGTCFDEFAEHKLKCALTDFAQRSQNMVGVGASEESSWKSGFLSYRQTSSCKHKSEEENISPQNNVRLSLTTSIFTL